jgi:hypothetical protein
MAGYVRVMIVGAQDVPCLLHRVFLFQSPGYGEVAHGLLHVVGEGTFPFEIGVGEGVLQAAAASSEYLPITPVPFFPDGPAQVAVLRLIKEKPGGPAYIFSPVPRAGAPVAWSKPVLGQLYLYQHHGAAAIWQPGPQHHVNSRRGFLGAGPFTVDFAKHMTRRHPLESNSVNGQLVSNQAADTLGQSLPFSFSEWQEKVEGKPGN